jgi:hypothetical protein
LSVPIPFARADVLLILVLPGVWLLARALARAVTRDRALRAILPFGLGLCLWLAVIHAASLAAGSLRVGLPVATLALAAVGAVLALARLPRAEPHDGEGEPPSPWLWLGVAASAALLAPAALRFWFHDELEFPPRCS